MPDKPKAVCMIGHRELENEANLVRARGCRVLFFDRSIDLDEALLVDVPIEVDLNDEDATIAQAQKLSQRFDIQGVYTLVEYRVPLAARMAEALGLGRGISYQAALNCRNKKLTRQRLAEHGVGSAQFALVRSTAEAEETLKTFALPVVVKPSNDSASFLVTRCDTVEQVLDSVRAVQQRTHNWVGQAIDPEILIEEYLDGPEFSVEAVTIGGETRILAVTAKRLTPPPVPVEAGHTVHAPLPEADVEAIHQLVKDALPALDVANSVTHTEVKLTSRGPRVVEVNARPGGDYIQSLVRAVTGYDLYELALHIAIGGTMADLPQHAPVASSAAVRFLTADHAGTLHMADPEIAASVQGVQTLHLIFRDGQQVETTTSNYNRLGHVIVHGTADESADEIAATVLEKLAVRID
jgi:biotin carboxylase